MHMQRFKCIIYNRAFDIDVLVSSFCIFLLTFWAYCVYLMRWKGGGWVCFNLDHLWCKDNRRDLGAGVKLSYCKYKLVQKNPFPLSVYFIHDVVTRRANRCLVRPSWTSCLNTIGLESGLCTRPSIIVATPYFYIRTPELTRLYFDSPDCTRSRVLRTGYWSGEKITHRLYSSHLCISFEIMNLCQVPL